MEAERFRVKLNNPGKDLPNLSDQMVGSFPDIGKGVSDDDFFPSGHVHIES